MTTTPRPSKLPIPRVRWIVLGTIALAGAAIALSIVVPIWKNQLAIAEIERLGGTDLHFGP